MRHGAIPESRWSRWRTATGERSPAVLRTAGDDIRVDATADRAVIRADDHDLAFVDITVLGRWASVVDAYKYRSIGEDRRDWRRDSEAVGDRRVRDVAAAH